MLVGAIICYFALVVIFLNKSLKLVAHLALLFFVVISFGPILAVYTLQQLTTTDSSIRSTEQNYMTAQRKAMRIQNVSNKKAFLADVASVDKIPVQDHPSPKVIYVLDSIAFGKPVSPLAMQYKKQRITSATFDFHAQHITFDLAMFLLCLGTISAVLTLPVSYLKKRA